MNSEERKAARRARREAERAAKRAERIEGCTLEAVADLDNLYHAARRARAGVSWKASVQRYQIDILRNCVKARQDLLDGRDIRRGCHQFDVCERGKVRHISSVNFGERPIHKSLTVNALVPALSPTFVHDNSANSKGKGTDFAIRRMKEQLARHYRLHGSEGYILLVDFSNYFGSIDHTAAKAVVETALDDERIISLVASLVDESDDPGLGLGSEPNQVIAVALPSRIDHFAAEMGGMEACGRYMDDSYFIHTDKLWLQAFLEAMRWRCAEIGLTVNDRKTRIVKLSRGFVFLKKHFSYGENGKIVVRPCRSSITRERRKLKKQKRLVDAGEMTMDQVAQSYQSWRGSMKRLDAHRTVLEMDRLYRCLFSPS
jgi:hypothetical protein